MKTKFPQAAAMAVADQLLGTLALTNGAIARGVSLMAYGSGIKYRNGEVQLAISERDVFELCGVPFLEPQNR